MDCGSLLLLLIDLLENEPTFNEVFMESNIDLTLKCLSGIARLIASKMNLLRFRVILLVVPSF